VVARKLPEYDEVRRLYVTGTSYTELAVRYGVGRGTVVRYLKRGTEARGLPWPIPDPTHTRKRTTGSRTQTVDVVGVRLALQEYERTKTESWESVADRAGVNLSWLIGVKNGRSPRIRKRHAAMVLRALGEQPHESLETWRPRVQTTSYGTRPVSA
jgi:hypothetical protein